MASAYEIQVTEAYIGLLGRAPDPAGLAYWVNQLETAVAGGQSAAVALKKLTNDIILGDEWAGGLGAQDISTVAGSENVVTTMYDRLFDRVATRADLDYWAPKLVSGEFSASEMAVALIQGAGNIDSQVLGYKQQAATFYVETVPQDNFTRGSATASVVDVNGPLTLQTSQTATNYVASGVGETFALTTSNADAFTLTAGSDTVTGVVGTDGTMVAADTITDTSTTDSDTVTITGDDDVTFATISGVETINVDIGKQVGGGYTLAAAALEGGTINLTVQPTVTIAGVSVTGETVATFTNLSSDLSTTGVTNLTVGLETGATEDVTITTDSSGTTVAVTGIVDAATNVVLGNDTATALSLGGSAATNDVASVTGAGTVTVAFTGGQEVELLGLASSSAAVSYDLGNVTAANMTYTTSGSNAVTLIGRAANFDGATFSMGATTALDIDTAGATLDLTGQGVFAGGIDLSADMNTAQIDVQTGNNITFSAAQTAGGVLTLVAANDTAADSLTLTLGANTQELLTTNFETVTIDTGATDITIDELDMDDNDAAVTVVGSGDITTTTGLQSGSLVMSGNDVTLAGTTSSASGDLSVTAQNEVTAAVVTGQNDVTLTSSEQITVTGALTATTGDVTLSATNDIIAVGVTATAGSVTTSGVDYTGTGGIAAQNDVTMTHTGGIALGANTVNATGGGGQNTITISGDNITAGAIGGATTRAVTLTMSNDATASNLDGLVRSTSSITLADGTFDGTGQNLQTESVIISGDTAVTATNIIAESVTNTSTAAVTISSLAEATAGEGVIVSAGSATGATNVTVGGAAGATTGTATVVTGSAADTVVLDENTAVNVTTGDGGDTVTITAIASGTINTGDGDDTVTDAEANTKTINLGGGNDTFTPASNADIATVDFGAGDGDTLVMTGDHSGAASSWTNYEILSLTGGTTLSAAQFAADNSFEMTGAQTLTIAATATSNDVDMSNMTFDIAALGNTAVTGNANVNVVTGSDAVDVVTGNAGDDTITGGGSNDTLTGSAGNDTLSGGTGADIIAGGADNDTITGGAGADHIDIAVTDATNGAKDTITDFVSGTDDLDLDGYTNSAGNLNHANVASAAGAVTLTSGSGVNEITGAALQSTPTDFANGTQVLAAISGTQVNCTANDDLLVVLYSGGKAYIYLFVDDNTDTNTTIEEDEITLIAVLDGIADGGLAAGDFV